MALKDVFQVRKCSWRATVLERFSRPRNLKRQCIPDDPQVSFQTLIVTSVESVCSVAKCSGQMDYKIVASNKLLDVSAFGLRRTDVTLQRPPLKLSLVTL